MFFVCRIVIATIILSWMAVSVWSISGPKPVRSCWQILDFFVQDSEKLHHGGCDEAPSSRIAVSHLLKLMQLRWKTESALDCHDKCSRAVFGKGRSGRAYLMCMSTPVSALKLSFCQAQTGAASK